MSILLALTVLLPLGAGMALGAPPELEIRIIYDNTSVRKDLQADWGFAALVKFGGQDILFDSGAKPEIFLANLRKLDIDPRRITHAVFSHEHADHVNGLFQLYPLNPSMEVCFLDAFPASLFRRAKEAGVDPVRVTGPREIVPGVYTTGTVPGPPPEQALVVETSAGLVVVTGCSHPGVEKLVEAAEKQRGKGAVHLVVGGFHLGRHSDAEVARLIERLKELRVARVIPTHCTGERAIGVFARAWGEGFGRGGAGTIITLP